jgi:LacI family transcriptional regulator
MDAPGRAREELAQFLAEFPRPGCVLCFEDRIAELATEECHRQQLRVPDDVAILSCGDDPLLTSLAEAPLSCIVFPSEEIGQAAAHLLHRLMRGEHAPAAVQRVPPRELRVRHSTDPAASADRVLGRAIVHMRQHLGQALPVTAIAAAAGVSRRALETRFREKLRKSIREQLQELRMEHATGLIRSTNLKLEDIALQSGFSSAATFSRAYRAHYGVPPSAHR